jgi:hypothetical protein
MLKAINTWLESRFVKQCQLWQLENQITHLRLMIQNDHRWLAHNPVADALTARYLAALDPDWTSKVHHDSAVFRRENGLEPDYKIK